MYNFISHVGGIEDKFQNKFPSHSQIIACFVGITMQASSKSGRHQNRILREKTGTGAIVNTK